MTGILPERERRVRMLLDAGRIEQANIAFDEVITVAPSQLRGDWSHATVLVHRASMAWRLGRIPLALELAAEGWSELDTDHSSGPAAAQTTGMLGFLLESIGHRDSALRLMMLSVRIARQADDPGTHAHCLVRAGNALLFRAVERSADLSEDRFATANELFEEALTVAPPGQAHRSALAGSARTLVTTGAFEVAKQRAEHALELSEALGDWHTASMAHWALAGLLRESNELEQARTSASRGLNAAEKTHDMILIQRFSLELAEICALLDDPIGEATALRRTVASGQSAVEALQEGLGQALEQRKVAVQAQRLAAAEQKAAVRDPLTGLLNRLGLERQAPELLEQTTARGHIPWLILVDVDGFKDVNDTAGHAAGDIVLREVANVLQHESRAKDLICRWAGDEFVVLLAESAQESREAGPTVAERLRTAVRNHDWPTLVGPLYRRPTVSIGVAAGPGQLDHLFTAADIALYKAKRAGRNRVEVERVEPERANPHNMG